LKPTQLFSNYAAIATLAIVSAGSFAQAPPPAPADHHDAPPAQATPQTFTPAADVQRSYNGLKANILKAAQNMPADAYSYRPTPDIRTFARVVNHVSEAQIRACGAINQTAPEARYKVPPDTADKATIVATLQASFAECDKAFASLTDANALQMLTSGPVTRARISYAWGTISHDNEQYATLALYMRLKGLAPPSTEK
jgi:hypothetical protein